MAFVIPLKVQTISSLILLMVCLMDNYQGHLHVLMNTALDSYSTVYHTFNCSYFVTYQQDGKNVRKLGRLNLKDSQKEYGLLIGETKG